MYFPSLSGGTGVAGGISLPSAPSSSSSGDSKHGDDITGKFDPSALERGAKALKELDNSPNASKAFEITKLQELTKQKEIQKDMEQLSAARAQAAAERSRIDAEERRKTINHQQEQERVTAQYKAQLEAEAYSKKLQDQQKQNEEWLQLQHQQFLRQEELRKKTEMEMLELRRHQMREEKAAEKEIMQAKIREETKGRIQQERENIDVHLKTLQAKAAEDRKTRLETIQQTFSGVAGGFNSLMDDKAKLTTFIGSLTAIAIGIYGARMGIRIAGKVIESRLGKPPLVRETSRRTFTRLFSVLNPFKWTKKKADFLEQIVLPDELSERLRWTTNSLISCRKNGTPFRHLCLYGPPGTGKTLFARTLARQSGLDYAIMTGGDVGPLSKDAVNEINKLFAWGTKTKNGLILFIDEADAFLRQGRGSLSGISEEMRNALSAFLHHTGTESDKICVVLATNCREILDKAVLDRVDEYFEFGLPSYDERKKMLNMFMNEYIFTPTKKGCKINVDPAIDDEFISYVAKRTEGFSGRQLSKLCISMQAAVFGSGTNVLTKGLAELVLQWKIAHFEDDIDSPSVDEKATEKKQTKRIHSEEKEGEENTEKQTYTTEKSAEVSNA